MSGHDQRGEWDRRRSDDHLTTRMNQLEARMTALEGPAREAIAAVREFQAGVKEREVRREEQIADIRRDMAAFRSDVKDSLNEIKTIIPNKNLTELMQRALFGVIGMIVTGVIAAWMFFLPGRHQ